jgi:hypothetical protein
MAADPPASAPAPDPMPAPAPPRKKKRGGPGLVPILVAVVLVVAIVLGVYFLFIKDDDDGGSVDQQRQSPQSLSEDLRDGRILAGPEQAPFAMRYTDDWETVAADDLETEGDAQPLAGIKRKDGTGVMTVTLGGPVKGGINTLRASLPGELEKRFDDFRLVAIRPVEIAAGRALYTSWVREETGRVQTNLVVPDGNRRSFAVDAVIKGGAQETAQEVGAIFRTFSIVKR